MALPWFKFYGGEYLSDPKMLSLTTAERCCLLTLLCYASLSENSGEVSYLTEEILMAQAGVNLHEPEWEKTVGVLKKFESLGIVTIRNDTVTIKNWTKRQYSEGYSRVLKFRKKNSNAKDNDREEKIREDKRREEKKIETPLQLFTNWKANPIWEKLVSKYPDRDYTYQFELMVEWWKTKKNKLPQNITAFDNWLKNTKPDPGLQAERMSEIKRAADKTKQEELAKIPPVNKETLDKLLSQKSKIGKTV